MFPRKSVLLPIIALLTALLGLVAHAQNDEWIKLLNDPQKVFGDFSEAEIDPSSVAKVRSLISDTVANQASKQIAARALWVGCNLEYQSMLTVTASSNRTEHAEWAAYYANTLRDFLRSHSILQNNEQDRLSWQDAVLRLRVIERELLRELGEQPLAAPLMARQAISQEFDPSTAVPLGNNPNSRVVDQLASLFNHCRLLAKSAIAARVQGSLTLGAVYGYLPNQQRIQALGTLSVDEINSFYPVGQKWSDLTNLVEMTFGGESDKGINGDYALAKKALANNSVIETSARNLSLLTTNTPIIRTVAATYGTDRLFTSLWAGVSTNDGLSNYFARINEQIGALPYYSTKLERPNWAEPEKFKSAGDTLAAALRELESRRQVRSLAWDALQDLKSKRQAVTAGLTNVSLLSTNALKNLTEIACQILYVKGTNGEYFTQRPVAEQFVIKAEEAWLKEFLGKVGTSFTIPEKQKKGDR